MRVHRAKRLRGGAATALIVGCLLAGVAAAPVLADIVGPEINVQPTSIDFGKVEVDTTSDAVSVTVSNSGDDDLDLGEATIPSEQFSIDTDICSDNFLAPGEQCNMDITFDPTTSGAKSSTLSIPSDDADEPVVNVSLTGFAPKDPDGSAGGGAAGENPRCAGLRRKLKHADTRAERKKIRHKMHALGCKR